MTTVKTKNDVSTSAVKTVDGVAVASIKTATGIDWPAGGGSPTVVQRFASGELDSGAGTTVDFTVGTVAVGDLVVFITWGLGGGGNENFSALSDIGSGNTINSRQVAADATYGYFTIYDSIVTVAGTMTLRGTLSGTFCKGHFVGEQWNGATYTYDSGASQNGTNGGFNACIMPTVTIGADRLVFLWAAGGFFSTNTPTPPGGWGSQTGAHATDAGTLVIDKLCTSAESPINITVPYSDFAYGMSGSTYYSYV